MANLELAAAFGAADAANEQDLRGYYPMAARVLAEEVRRLKARLKIYERAQELHHGCQMPMEQAMELAQSEALGPNVM